MSLLEKIVKNEQEAKQAVMDAKSAQQARASARQRRIARVRRAIIWHGWRLVDVSPRRFAFTKLDNEAIRAPDHGSYTLTEAEQFLAARDRERWSW